MRSGTGVLGAIALGLLMAACGTTQDQRAATGGLTGLGAGAIIGGPLGAAVGAAAGAAGGMLMPEDATSIANNLLGREHRAANNLINGTNGPATSNAAPAEESGSSIAPNQVKEAQQRLKDEELYKGKIDGIAGPQTRSALRQYQQREGLRQTGRLDQQTWALLNGHAPQSGSSAAPANAGPGNANVNRLTTAPNRPATAPQSTAPGAPANQPTNNNQQ